MADELKAKSIGGNGKAREFSPGLVLGDVERVHAAFDVMLQPIRPGVGELDGVLRRVGGDSGNLACGGRYADHGRPRLAPQSCRQPLGRRPDSGNPSPRIHAGTLTGSAGQVHQVLRRAVVVRSYRS